MFEVDAVREAFSEVGEISDHVAGDWNLTAVTRVYKLC